MRLETGQDVEFCTFSNQMLCSGALTRIHVSLLPCICDGFSMEVTQDCYMYYKFCAVNKGTWRRVEGQKMDSYA